MTRLHATVAILVCLVVPAASRMGAGLFAWTMYSRSAGFRLEVRGRDAGGALTAISPTELAARGRGPAVMFLAAVVWQYNLPGRTFFGLLAASQETFAVDEGWAATASTTAIGRPHRPSRYAPISACVCRWNSRSISCSGRPVSRAWAIIGASTSGRREASTSRPTFTSRPAR